MSDARTVLHANVSEAHAAYKALEKQVEAEARAAADAVRASYREQLTALSRATGAAQVALRADIDANATHEWEGKRVVKTITKTQRWGNKSWSEKVFGIVEVRRSDTSFPANVRYGTPNMGQAFVRLLKKDGKPGLQFDRSLGSNRYDESEWVLDAEVVA